MGVIQSEEPRTFEQRFGTHCPFCGRPWGSAERCDPMPVEVQWRESNRFLFAKEVIPDRSCVVCQRLFTPRAQNAKLCDDPRCRVMHNRAMWNSRSLRRNSRRRETRRQARLSR